MPITRTSLKHPTIKAKLDNAMREACIRSATPRNQGLGIAMAGSIRVCHSRPDSGFRFFDPKTRDITTTVLTVLREA